MKTLKIRDRTHKRLTMVKGGYIASTGDPNLTYDDTIKRLIEFWNENSEDVKALEPYHYVRFRWWDKANLESIAEELGVEYGTEWSMGPGTDEEINLRKDERSVLKVRSDTLGAYLDVYKAVMFQKDAAPFTVKDAELRERLLELYDKERPTPFPWQFLEEPRFVTLEEA